MGTSIEIEQHLRGAVHLSVVLRLRFRLSVLPRLLVHRDEFVWKIDVLLRPLPELIGVSVLFWRACIKGVEKTPYQNRIHRTVSIRHPAVPILGRGEGEIPIE